MKHPLVLALDPELAAEVARALTRHRQALDGRVPAAFDALLAAVVKLALSGPERTRSGRSGQPAADRCGCGHDEDMGNLLSIDRAANMAGVSERTLRRRIASKELPAVRDGRRVLIARQALLAYLDNLEAV